MNFKRKKSKRQVRCTMCTADRWKGNSKGRFKEKEEYRRKQMQREIDVEERDVAA